MIEQQSDGECDVEAESPRTFSLASLLVAVSLVCVCLALALTLGIVLGSFAACLGGVYYVARRINRKVVFVSFVVVTFFAALPWVGVHRGAFVVPFGAQQTPPTVSLPRSVREILLPAYEISVDPLEVTTLLSGRFGEAMLFKRGGGVKPFVYFVFWAGVALVLAAALLVNIAETVYRRRTSRGSEKGTSLI